MKGADRIMNENQDDRGKVIIHSYKDLFIVDIGMWVYKDKKMFATLYRNTKIEFTITKPTNIKLSHFINSLTHHKDIEILVFPNVTTEIWVGYKKTTKLQILNYKVKPNKKGAEHNEKE